MDSKDKEVASLTAEAEVPASVVAPAPSDAQGASKTPVRLFTTQKSWVEGEALRQLEATAALPGMKAAYGMPDLHPGRGNPIGASFLSECVVYPYLVGSDIGCGMQLVATGLSSRKSKRDRWARDIYIEGPWEDEEAKVAIQAAHNLPADLYAASLGTIGGGNHFAELLSVDEVMEAGVFDAVGLDKGELYLLVHSGSRGLGEAILRDHTSRFGDKGLALPGEESERYMARHDQAVAWATANRAAVAARFSQSRSLSFEPRIILDICHNSVSRLPTGQFLHRKGAAPHAGPLVVIPGSRGALSYLVEPLGPGDENGWSLAHGAGRKWTRANTQSRMREKYRAQELQQTPMGNIVICEDKDMLFEEAPDAYKKITDVVFDLTSHGLIRVVATLRPLITYKMRQDSCCDDG